MTENEVLIKTPEEAIETIKSNMPTSGYQMLRESLDMAIEALKEVQQYREIGASPEQLKELIFEGSATKRILRHYQEIGTVEEVREAWNSGYNVGYTKGYDDGYALGVTQPI